MPRSLLASFCLVAFSAPPLSAQIKPPATRPHEPPKTDTPVLQLAAAERDPVAEALKGLKWRSVGPANNAARISVVAGVPGDPYPYYVAGANGGIIKTVNGGTTFKPVFDKQSVGSIGATAAAPSDPNIIYI